MKIDNFEDFINSVILERGQKYYKRGKIVELSANNGVYSALVEGSECYEVMVEVDQAGKIIDHNCSCPYDMGDICKHKVAVFYAIRNNEHLESTSFVTTKNDNMIKEQSLKELLSPLTREQLQQIILTHCEDDRIFHMELTHKYSPNLGDLKSSKKLIMSYIGRNKQQGFIKYGKLGDALEGADMVISDAQTLCDSGEYIKSLDLFLMTNGIVTEVISYSDDDGDISIRLDECMLGIALIVTRVTEKSDKKLWKDCFDKIVSESKNPIYDGWGYGLELLDCCVGFCQDKELSDKLWQILDEFPQQLNKTIDRYYYDQINTIKHRILCLIDDDAAEKFEKANITNISFRKILIERYLARKDYDKALMCCENIPFTVICDYLLLIYKSTGQIDNYRNTLLEAICKHNIAPYFNELKATYDEDEWTAILPSVLDKVEQAKININYDYRELLIKYRLFDRLLKCVKNNIGLIVNYYKELNVNYPDEVKNIFTNFLTQRFASANNRSQYAECCRLMRIFKKACGGEVMRQLRDKMHELYIRKPALVDELNNLN